MRRTFLALAALVCLAGAMPARADDPAITTTGTATVFAVPDEAVISVTIISHDADLAKACAANEANGDKLVKAIKGVGIAGGDIATDTLAVNAHYVRPDPRGEAQIEGFDAVRNYAVTLHDLKQIQTLFNAMVHAEVNAMPSVELRCSNTRTYRDRARAMAIHAAQEKATALAEELKCTVGKPHTIIEGTTGASGRAEYANNRMEMATDRPIPDTPEGTPIGRIEIQATVTVTFELK